MAFDFAGRPSIADPGGSRTDPDTVVFATLPSPDGRRWWQGEGRSVLEWPTLADGHTVALYQERASGARVVTLPNPALAAAHLDDPVYRALLRNAMERLAGAR